MGDRSGAEPRALAEVNSLCGALKVLDVKNSEWVDVRVGGADVAARHDFCCAFLGLRACFADRAIALGGRAGAGAPRRGDGARAARAGPAGIGVDLAGATRDGGLGGARSG